MKSQITGIETFNKTLDYGEAGDNVGVLIRGLNRDQINRGLVIGKPGSLQVNSVIEANVYILKTEEGGRVNPFSSGYRPQVLSYLYSYTTKLLILLLKFACPKESKSQNLEITLPSKLNLISLSPLKKDPGLHLEKEEKLLLLVLSLKFCLKIQNLILGSPRKLKAPARPLLQLSPLLRPQKMMEKEPKVPNLLKKLQPNHLQANQQHKQVERQLHPQLAKLLQAKHLHHPPNLQEKLLLPLLLQLERNPQLLQARLLPLPQPKARLPLLPKVLLKNDDVVHI